MVCEKVNIKKSSTLMSVVVTLILVIGFFTIMFLWFSNNASQADIDVNSDYYDSYTRINEQQSILNGTVTDIQTKLNSVTEANNVVQVAWNGMLLLGTTILATKDFTTVTIGTFSSLMDVGSSAGISPSIFALATIGLIAFIVFLVIANLKGEPKMIN